MAGNAVKWTPEMRARMAEQMRARRAAETPKEKAASAAKRAATLAADPSIETKRAAKISKTRRLRRDVMSDAARKGWEGRSEDARAASLTNLKSCNSAQANAKRSKTLETPLGERRKLKEAQAWVDAMPPVFVPRPPPNNKWSEQDKLRISRQSQAWWDSLSEEERAARSQRQKEYWDNLPEKQRQSFSQKRQDYWDRLRLDKVRYAKRVKDMHDGRRLKPYVLLDGTVQPFRSSWEAACANVFIHMGCSYQSEVQFILGGRNYFADFVLGNVIVEVKGYPDAWKRWNEDTLPRIKKHLVGDWQVYLLDNKTRLRPSGLQEFLGHLTHVVSGLPAREGVIATVPVDCGA